MDIRIEIDEKSGFCYGVVRAIEQAENYLENHPDLMSLGSIVHNNSELNRLSDKGLNVINYKQLTEAKDKSVLFRAHGEPPSSYKIAELNNLKIIDCTCPVVLNLQNRVKKSYEILKPLNGQVVIFGKPGHAEVNGLAGQVGGDVTIIRHIDDLNKVDFGRSIHIFAQTTKDPEEYKNICNIIKDRIIELGGPIETLKVHNTICGQVSNRRPNLREFSRNHDVIIFVSGADSSNGKVLFELCKSQNPKSYKIETPKEIDINWLKGFNSVGICGATSTPKWLLDETAKYIAEL